MSLLRLTKQYYIVFSVRVTNNKENKVSFFFISYCICCVYVYVYLCTVRSSTIIKINYMFAYKYTCMYTYYM